MSHRRYSVITCDIRKDHRCWRATSAYETERAADEHARSDGWRCDPDVGDICPACQEETP